MMLNENLNEVINYFEVLEKKTAKNIIIISDLTKFILINKLSFEDLTLFLRHIVEIFLKKKKSIIFPTFINPLLNKGVVNLDSLKSNSGILSEVFRKMPGVKRTINPFFSYSIIGESQTSFININPEYDWSTNSHLGWMEKNNISSIILGTFPENNPLVHRMEYINKNRIKYREIKRFKNKIIYNSKELEHIQYYFGLRNGYEHINYKDLFNKYSITEIDTYLINSLSIYHYKASIILDIINKEIENNILYREGKKKNK